MTFFSLLFSIQNKNCFSFILGSFKTFSFVSSLREINSQTQDSHTHTTHNFFQHLALSFNHFPSFSFFVCDFQDIMSAASLSVVFVPFEHPHPVLLSVHTHSSKLTCTSHNTGPHHSSSPQP